MRQKHCSQCDQKTILVCGVCKKSTCEYHSNLANVTDPKTTKKRLTRVCTQCNRKPQVEPSKQR